MVVPKRFEICTFDSYRVDGDANKSAAMEACRRWAGAAGVGPWALCLLGTPGVGKTHLAAAVARSWGGRGRVEWHYAPDLEAALIAETFDRSDRSAPLNSRLTAPAAGSALVRRADGEWERIAPSPCLLVIDDLGASSVNALARAAWCRLLDGRYRNGLPTLVTSNALGRDEFAGLDPRIASRFAEGVTVVIAGRDYRSRSRA